MTRFTWAAVALVLGGGLGGGLACGGHERGGAAGHSGGGQAQAAAVAPAESNGGGHHRGGGHAHDVEVPGEVLALDAWAAGGTIDVLLALRGEHGAEHGDRLVHRRSTDGGRTWSAEHEVDLGGRPMHAPHRGMDPQIAADGDRLLALWTVPGTSPWGIGPMATAFSADGGRTWTPGPTPADDGRTDGHNYIDAAVDDRGVFHAVWLDNRDSGARGLSTSSSHDGLTWTHSRSIDETTCECCWNRIYARPGGRLDVLYRDKLPTDLVVAASSDRGASWRRVGTPGGFGWQFEGCPHTGGALARPPGEPGELHALSWTGADGRAGLWALASLDGGVTWSDAHRMGSESARHGDLAAVGGRLIAVWSDDARIVAATSDDRGATWSAPQALSEPGRRATHPLVVASGDGALALWTETGDEGGSTWAARRLDGV